eukprot:4988657-Amphidinium_carterae.1
MWCAAPEAVQLAPVCARLSLVLLGGGCAHVTKEDAHKAMEVSAAHGREMPITWDSGSLRIRSSLFILETKAWLISVNRKQIE